MENEKSEEKVIDERIGGDSLIVKENTTDSEIVVKKTKIDVMSLVGFASSIVACIIMLIFLISMTTTNGIGMAILLLLAFIAYGIPAALSMVFSIVGLINSIKVKRRGKTFAIVGLVLTVVSALALIVFVSTYHPSQEPAFLLNVI